MLADEGTEPFAQLARLRGHGIQRSRRGVVAKMSNSRHRHGMGPLEPGEKIVAIRQPLNLAAGGRRDAVEKIERAIVADKKRRGPNIRHCDLQRAVPNRSRLRNPYSYD